MDIEQSYDYCQQLATTHYENFPVGSLLIRKDLRPHVHAIYAFARTADDFADEPGLEKLDRLDKLAEWDRLLDQAVGGSVDHPIFIALAQTIRRFDLPVKLFHDLVRAFRQDVTVNRYQTMEQLIQSYCRNSANPVGRLVLLLHGYREESLMHFSDCTCTALQLANFWQDIAIDLDKDRLYLPLEDLKKFNLSVEDISRCRVGANGRSPLHMGSSFQELIRYEINFTRELFKKGAPLIPCLKGRLQWEIKATWLGGMGILDKIEQVNYDIFQQRPQWSKWEMIGLFLRAVILSEADDKKKSNFYLALLLLPKKKRQAMFTFYSFCRAVDDAVDLASSPSEAKRKLDLWRYQIALCYDGCPTQTDAQQLQKVIRQYQIPRQEIEDILRGVEMDIAANHFQTFQELEEYCYCVASAVGLVSSRIFGVQEERGRDFAILLGKALQLTNILRDIKEDAQKGRVYIPQNDLEQFDYSEENLRRLVQDEPVLKLINFQCRRARLFFEKADTAFESLSKENQKKFLPARVMEAIYKAILDQIEKNPAVIFSKRVTVPLWKKMVIALKYIL